MIVVGQEVAEDASLSEPTRQHVVVRLDRSPTAVDEVVASCHQFAPGRHTGKRASPMVVEDEAAFRQTLQVRRPNPVTSGGLQIVAAHAVQDDEQGLHFIPPRRMDRHTFISHRPVIRLGCHPACDATRAKRALLRTALPKPQVHFIIWPQAVVTRAIATSSRPALVALVQ